MKTLLAILAAIRSAYAPAWQLGAVVTLSSDTITNLDAGPPVKASATVMRGKVRECVETKEITSGDSIASIYRMVRIRSSDRVSGVFVFCDAITSAAGDIGLYDTTANGGAVVDVDHFASANSIATAVTAPVNLVYEATPANVANIAKPVWQALGLTADPGRDYDVALTLTAAATATGTYSLKVVIVEN